MDFFSEETIEKFRFTRLSADMAAAKGAVYFEKLGFPYIITPILMNGVQVASLTAFVPGKFGAGEIQGYLDALADFVKNRFYIDRFQVAYQSSPVEIFLRDLLNGQAGSQWMVQERSRYFGFRTKDIYVLLTIDTSAAGIGFPAMYFQNVVRHNFPSAISFLYQESILVLFRFREFGEYETLALESIADYLQKYDMRGCVGTPFVELSGLPTAYRQTLRGIFLGSHLYPNQSLYDDAKMALYHLLEAGSESMALESLCHPAVLRLHEYDKAHGSDYVNTLYQLLTHRTRQTAQQELYIHRNTLKHRLEKINSLVCLHWEDGDEMFSVLLSCRILRYLAEYS